MGISWFYFQSNFKLLEMAAGEIGLFHNFQKRQYYTLLEQKAIILTFISIIDINVNLSKNEIDKKINLN